MVENEIISSRYKSFEDIKHFDENNNEYWLARELQIQNGQILIRL